MRNFTIASLKRHHEKGRRVAENIQYYNDFSDDIVQTRNPDYRIPEDYVWIKKKTAYRLCSAMCYGMIWIIGLFYCKCRLHMHIKNKKVLSDCKDTGFFLYANHTQPLGDVVMPAYVAGKKRIYTIVSQENMGIPIIGKILPALGALPIPTNMKQMKRFLDAVKIRATEGNGVVIYPEAHVWPYYNKIRKFPGTSFRFPIENQLPAFAMTVTYQKRRLGKRPKVTVYVDGPFWPDCVLGRKEQRKKLKNEIYAIMEKRSLCSTYEYIQYRKAGG